jgi:hypothetical protein
MNKDECRINFLKFCFYGIETEEYKEICKTDYDKFHDYIYDFADLYSNIYELYKHSITFDNEFINELIDSQEKNNLILCIELLKQLYNENN